MACDAPSLKPIPGAYFGRGGNAINTDGAHLCTLPEGHDGPHTKETRTRVASNYAMRSRYIWDDEHTLRCLCDVVEVEPPPTDYIRVVIRDSNST